MNFFRNYGLEFPGLNSPFCHCKTIKTFIHQLSWLLKIDGLTQLSARITPPPQGFPPGFTSEVPLCSLVLKPQTISSSFDAFSNDDQIECLTPESNPWLMLLHLGPRSQRQKPNTNPSPNPKQSITKCETDPSRAEQRDPDPKNPYRMDGLMQAPCVAWLTALKCQCDATLCTQINIGGVSFWPGQAFPGPDMTNAISATQGPEPDPRHLYPRGLWALGKSRELIWLLGK